MDLPSALERGDAVARLWQHELARPAQYAHRQDHGNLVSEIPNSLRVTKVLKPSSGGFDFSKTATK